MPAFTDFNLDPLILKSLERMEFKEPSAIQTQAIPLILQKKDLIALAKTGSGKTATCAIPICDQVNVENPRIQALIIVPTRELALQYATETQKIGRDKKVKAFAIFGGEDPHMQQSKLKHGVQVLIATPGRLIDFIYSRLIDLTSVETLILDEADEMLSMGFYDDLEFIMQCLVQEHQTLLFSATMPNAIKEIAKKHMKEPAEVCLLTEDAIPESIQHQFFYCRHDHRDEALCSIIEKMHPKQAIIFCHSRHQCEKLCHVLQRKYDAVDFLHAGLGQDVRTIITSKFRSGRIRFLVATDVAARGLDFSGVTHVFIYQLSEDLDAYLHRSGRTGRQEREGVVISMVTDRDKHIVKQILHKIKREPIWIGAVPQLDGGRPPSRRPYKQPSKRNPPKAK